MAKVSICIPTYNNAAALIRLLDSVEAQDFRDYEVIITDDSQGDEIGRLAAERGYIQYYKNQTPLGASANWNAAIAKSSGEYVKLMHHDDWFTTSSSLGQFVGLIEAHPEVDMVFSGSRQVEGKNYYDRFASQKEIAFIRKDWRNLFLGNIIGAPSAVMVRRRVADRISYDENLTWLVDMEYDMNILKENPCFVYTEEPLVSIGVSREQLTESCRENKELNVSEYGYLYLKYHLGDKRPYRRKLMKVCADAGKSGEQVAVFGINKAEYGMELGGKLLSKIQWKLTHLISAKLVCAGLFVLLFFSLLPVLMLSGVNCATGDDFGYGVWTRQAWLTSGSLIEVIKAAGRTVAEFYRGWQGTWFSIFLFALQPEVFSSQGYFIVPTLMLTLWLLSTALLFYQVLVRLAGWSKWGFGSLYALFSLAVLQFVPSTKSAIFWYNGTAHYVVPYTLALLSIFCYLRWLTGAGSQRGVYLGLAVCMTLLGGGNYQAALLAPLVMILSSVVFWFQKEKRKRILACLLPLLLEAIGLVISFCSPGNKSRGGEDFGFRWELAVKTIFSCLVRGAVQAVEYIRENPLLLLIFAVAAVMIWRFMPEGKGRKPYPYPWLFVPLSYGVYCAMFAPEIYAGVEVSGGVYNMNFYVFLFLVFGAMIDIEGFILSRRKRQEGAMLPVLILAGMGFLLVFRGNIKETTFYQCVEYITSGQAADFKEQMVQQKRVLLDNEIREAVLPPINDNQGPLMHMPLTDNPEAWTNRVTGQFYGKDSVVTGITCR